MAVVFTDNFNTGTAGTPLNGRAGTGGTWTTTGAAAADQGALKITASGQVSVGGTTTGCLAAADVGGGVQYAKVALQVASAAGVVAVRALDWNNFVGLRWASATQIEVYRRIGGTETPFAPKITVGTIAVPFTLELRFNGSNAFAFYNGAQVGTPSGYALTAGEIAALGATTRVGLWGKASTTVTIADDFEGGTLVSAVAPVGGRSPSRVGSAAVQIRFALVAAGGRSPGRAVSPALSPGGSGVAVARGRSPSRAAFAVLGWMGTLAPTRAASATRATGTRLTLFPSGQRTPVRAETRTIPVTRG